MQILSIKWAENHTRLQTAEKFSAQGVCGTNSFESGKEEKLVRSIFTRLKPNYPEVLSASAPRDPSQVQLHAERITPGSP